MSEPIQSISQGNYILQGTVATSAGIVGDGSTQNPLRADETVLWTGNVAIGTEMTLSEPFQNFKDIRIMNGHNGYWTAPAWTLTGNQDGIFEYGYAGNITSTASNNFSYEHYATLYSGHDNKLKATSSIGFTITTGGTLTRSVNANNYSTRTFKIVGINRINNA